MGRLSFLKSIRIARPAILVATISLAVVLLQAPLLSAVAQTETEVNDATDLASFNASDAIPPVKTALTSPETFSDIPTYTGGAKYLSGSKSERDSGSSFVERWLAKEERQQILDWYQLGLTNAGWKVEKDSASSISGKKEKGQTVQVIVNPLPLTDGYKCELLLQVFRRKG